MSKVFNKQEEVPQNLTVGMEHFCTTTLPSYLDMDL